MIFNNKSFVFIPFSSQDSLQNISNTLDVSGAWGPICEDDVKEINKNARYLLKYVSDRIDYVANPSSICIQRKYNFTNCELNRRLFFNEDKSLKKFSSVCIVATPEQSDKDYNTIITQKNQDAPLFNKTSDFSFENVYLFCFDTGINLLCYEIKYYDDDYNKISECLFNIKRATYKNIIETNLLKNNAEKSTAYSELNKYSLTELSEGFLSELNILDQCQFFEHASHNLFQRVNIFTYYETDATDSALIDDMLFRLSHCYSSKFKYCSDTDDKYSKYKNNSVCYWGITSESSACISFPSDAYDDFVVNVFRDNIKEGYLLMYALLLNQKYELYNLLIETGRCLSCSGENTYEEAKRYRDKFYVFDQKYNFKIITEVTQYQNVYDIMYKEFKIDQLMIDVKQPLDAINSILKEEELRIEEENDKKTQKALTVLSILAVFSALTDSWTFITFFQDIISKGMWESSVIQLLLSAIILVAYLIFVIGIIKRYFKKKK